MSSKKSPQKSVKSGFELNKYCFIYQFKNLKINIFVKFKRNIYFFSILFKSNNFKKTNKISK